MMYIFLCTDTPQELQQMLQELSDESRRMGLNMNIAKTMVMVVDNTPIKGNNVLIENVQCYVYLGQHYSIKENNQDKAINGMVKRLCMEEDVGYVDLWDSLVGKEEMYARDGLHLSGKGAAVFAEGLSGAVASGLGKVRYLN